jgi:hypothetical protein
MPFHNLVEFLLHRINYLEIILKQFLPILTASKAKQKQKGAISMFQNKKVTGALAVALTVGTLLTGVVSGGEVFADQSKTTVQSPIKQKNAVLLLETKKLAKQGKVTTSGEFKLGSAKSEIVKKWGNPDKDSKQKSGELKYSKRQVSFFVGNYDGHKDSVYSLHNFDKRYANVSYKDVKNTLGAGKEYKGKNDGYLTYEVGGNILTFYFNVKNGTFTNIKYVEVTLP